MNVVVLGELCEDILMHNPNSVEVFEQKIWAKDVTVTAGGSAVYVSQALSRMGVDVRLCAARECCGTCRRFRWIAPWCGCFQIQIPPEAS